MQGRGKHKEVTRKVEAFFETLLLSIVFYLLWRDNYRGEAEIFYHRGKYLFAGVYFIILYFSLKSLDAFKFGRLKAVDVFFSQWIGLFCADILEYFIVSLISNGLVSPAPMLAFFAGECVFGTIYTVCCSLLYHRLYAADRMLMVYGQYGPGNLEAKFGTRPDKYNITRAMSEEAGYHDIERELSRGYDALVINDVSAYMHNALMKYCYVKEITVFITPKISDILIKGSFDVTLFDTPLYVVNSSGPNMFERFLKRFFGVVFSSIALVVLSPVFLIVALAIKLDDHGPVFYRQERVGKDERHFNILKFRSMIVGAEKAGEVKPAVDGDPRITRVGRFIRATRIDELPQLINILCGDMAFVGPRPERVEHVEKYQRDIPEFFLRHKVPMGLTGFAQIYGKYNTSAYDKLRLDLMYIQRYSLFLDLKMLLLTVRVLFKKESTEGFK